MGRTRTTQIVVEHRRPNATTGPRTLRVTLPVDDGPVGASMPESLTVVATYDTQVAWDVWNGVENGPGAVRSGAVSFDTSADPNEWSDLLRDPGFCHRLIERTRELADATGWVVTPPAWPSVEAVHLGPRRVAVVLGAPNDADGTLSPTARARLRAGLDVVEEGDADALVLTGGFGEWFNRSDRPHYDHLIAELGRWGVGREVVAACIASRHSADDALGIRWAIEAMELSTVHVVTSADHRPRIDLLVEQATLASGAELRWRTTAGTPVVPERERDALRATIVGALVFGPLGWSHWLPAG